MDLGNNVTQIILAVITAVGAATIGIKLYRKSSKKSGGVNIKNSTTGDVAGRDMYKAGRDINK